MLSRSIIVASFSLAMFHAVLNADPVIYVVSADITGNGKVGTINLTTGSYQQVGPIEPDGYFGLASGPDGSLVAGTYAGNLDSINPVSGVPTLIGPTGLGACVIPSPACGVNTFSTLGGLGSSIYAVDYRNNLYTITSATGSATLLSSHSGIPAIPFIPGLLNPDETINFYDEAIWGAGGKLYATFDSIVFDLNSLSVVSVSIEPKLYQIDPATGLATVIGAVDLGIGAVIDVNGTSYAFNDLTNHIESIDLSNGKTTFVATFDAAAGVVQGAALVNTPEPRSLLLASLGVLGLAAWRHKIRCLENG